MQFPIDTLTVRRATLEGGRHGQTLSLDLAAFTIPLRGEDQTFLTAAVFDGIDLPSTRARDLAGQVYDFPANPDDGYIDGSIYIDNRHHPVDATRLAFGPITGDVLPLTLTTRLVLSFEKLASYADTDWTITVDLPLSEFD
ncbi:hypothetical protein [Pseudooceanicola onchidii]|uniref:hypothetical protein n=1 Tax=Pseudooceanicola onchidii TaxID=2562279 RepID=UPI0010AB1357|nr:hypothetical protein [Pseudooceanicola onchidii]